MRPEPTYIISNTNLFAFLNDASKNKLVLMIFWVSMLLFLLLFILVFLKNDLSFLSRLEFTFYGLIIAFMCMPIHEAIHYFTFKKLGARNLKIENYWKRGYILTRADKFVVGKKEILPLATLPFLILSLTGVLFYFLSALPISISIASAMLLHGSFCQSDFSILAYFFNDKNEKSMVDLFDKDQIHVFVFDKRDKSTN